MYSAHAFRRGLPSLLLVCFSRLSNKRCASMDHSLSLFSRIYFAATPPRAHRVSSGSSANTSSGVPTWKRRGLHQRGVSVRERGWGRGIEDDTNNSGSKLVRDGSKAYR